jgi:phage terminase large subunit
LIEIPRAFSGLFKPKRFKVYYGGRGSAKSASFARALLIIGKQKRTRILCAREIQNSIADSVHKLFKDLINETPEFSDYEVIQNLVRHPNGTEFIFKGLRHNIQDIKSTESVDICWVEEAQSVSSDSWDVLIPTIRNAGSEIWISFNPEMEDDPTYERFVKNADGDMHVMKVNYDANPFFSDVLRSEMERDKQRDYDKYLHIWEGEFKRTTDSAILKNWEVKEFEPPYKTEFMYGADWGFANDPTTLNRMFVIDKTIYIDYEAHGVGTEIDDLEELFVTVPMAKQHVIRADSARPELISHLNRKGFRITAAKKGAGSIEDGVENLRNYKIIIHPRCKHTVQEFARYSYKVHRLTGDILPDIVDAWNHHIDGIRYACEPLMNNRARMYENLI